MRLLLRLRDQLRRALQAFDSVDKLIDYASQQQAFTDYLLKHVKEGQVWPLLTTREDADAFLNYIAEAFHLTMKGTSVLELGPGHGYFLEAVRDRGGTADFIDYNPYLVAYNRLRGFHGYEHDWFGYETLPLLTRAYDLVFSKGAMNADRVNRWIAESGTKVWHDWLGQVEQRIAADGFFFLCPTFDRDSDGDHRCHDPAGFHQSPFTQVLMQRGYARVFVTGFNHRLRFPSTFWWQQHQ